MLLFAKNGQLRVCATSTQSVCARLFAGTRAILPDGGHSNKRQQCTAGKLCVYVLAHFTHTFGRTRARTLVALTARNVATAYINPRAVRLCVSGISHVSPLMHRPPLRYHSTANGAKTSSSNRHEHTISAHQMEGRHTTHCWSLASAHSMWSSRTPR